MVQYMCVTHCKWLSRGGCVIYICLFSTNIWCTLAVSPQWASLGKRRLGEIGVAFNPCFAVRENSLIVAICIYREPTPGAVLDAQEQR